ncbi:hypothetical protein V1290_000011 [Bradyrhizobium sp. AZCC 1578]|uniref:DUF968 domain-containing protein n=1 Tax=Bradyrhizobium sp. AZCC 1578 TaxID=3117027 RepID=UPI002FF2A31B
MRTRQRLPRQRDEQHLDFIRSLICISCGDNTSTEAAHLRSANRLWGKDYTGKQEKPSDMWSLPLCNRCHREQHSCNEVQFWQERGINPWSLALRLYAASGNHELAQEVIATRGIQ